VDCASGHKRNPTKGASGAMRHAPPRSTFYLITAYAPPLSDRLESVRSDAYIAADTRKATRQLRIARPPKVPFSGMLLRPAAPIPYLVARLRHAAKMLPRNAVLDAVTVGEDHLVGRSSVIAELRSRGRWAVERSAVSPFVHLFSLAIKAEVSLGDRP
jgi:hypothetical protein